MEIAKRAQFTVAEEAAKKQAEAEAKLAQMQGAG